MFSEDRAKCLGFKSLDTGNIDRLFPMLCFEKESLEVPLEMLNQIFKGNNSVRFKKGFWFL